MTLVFRRLNQDDKNTVTTFIKNFYTEDTYVKTSTEQKIKNTFNELEKHPEKGCIMVAENNGILIGYSILIYYWSNEFGGNIVYIDELYITKTSRGKGIGTQFIQYIMKSYHHQAVALQLEITKHNIQGRRFYQKLGFVASSYDRLIHECKY